MKDVKKFIRAKKRKKKIKKLTLMTVVIGAASFIFFTKAPIFNIKTISFNGKVLKEANISLEDITPTLNFTIHIVNNSGEKFAYNMNLTVDLNGIYDGYSYKGKTTSGTEYQFFKEINNL